MNLTALTLDQLRAYAYELRADQDRLAEQRARVESVIEVRKAEALSKENADAPHTEP